MSEENDKNKEREQEEQPQGAETPEPGDATSKLAEAEKQVEMYKDLMYRKAAEFENFKKRSENESASIVKYANEALISELIPVLDDFERSLKAAKSSKDFDSLFRGIEMIYQKLVKNLGRRGVKSFETLGKEFDVAFHDALLQIPREDVAPHTVLEEVEKGYTLHDKVIRHAKVIVSTTPADGSTSTGTDQPVSENQPESGKR